MNNIERLRHKIMIHVLKRKLWFEKFPNLKSTLKKVSSVSIIIIAVTALLLHSIKTSELMTVGQLTLDFTKSVFALSLFLFFPSTLLLIHINTMEKRNEFDKYFAKKELLCPPK